MKTDERMYGYARCSTNEQRQDIDRQVRELRAMGCDRVYLEYEHGDSPIKKELERLFADIPEGGTIAATEPIRFARSTRQMCELIDRIKARRLKLVIKNSVTIDCRGGILDPMSNAFLQMSGVFGELELQMTRARVRSGLQNAIAKGKTLGRPRLTEAQLPPKFFRDYPKYKRGELSKTDFARICGVSRPTLDRYLALVEPKKKTP